MVVPPGQETLLLRDSSPQAMHQHWRVHLGALTLPRLLMLEEVLPSKAPLLQVITL